MSKSTKASKTTKPPGGAHTPLTATAISVAISETQRAQFEFRKMVYEETRRAIKDEREDNDVYALISKAMDRTVTKFAKASHEKG